MSKPYLVNPPKKRKTARKGSGSRKRKAPKGGWKAHMAKVRAGKKTGGSKVATRKRKRSSSRKTTATRRRRRTTTAAKAAPRKRRRYRRNPPIAKQAMQTAQNAAVAVGGKVIARAVPQQVNALLGRTSMSFRVPDSGPLGALVQGGVAIVAGVAARRFVSRNTAEYLMLGGIMGGIETAAQSFGEIPIVSDALSGYGQLGSYGQLGRYAPTLLPAGGVDVSDFAEVGESWEGW